MIARIADRFPGTRGSREAREVLIVALAGAGLSPECQGCWVAGHQLVTQARRRWYVWPLIAAYVSIKLLALLFCVGEMPPLQAALALGFALAVEWFLLAPRRGCNVAARVEAREEPRREVVLVAHRDSVRLAGHEILPALALWGVQKLAGQLPALAGWSGRVGARFAGGRRFRRIVVGVSIVLLFAALLIAFLWFRGSVPAAWATLVWLWSFDAAFMRPWPVFAARTGANDNATGVAALVGLAGRLGRRPLAHTTVSLVLSDAEELGMQGFRTWLRRNPARAVPRYFLAVDSIGEGRLGVHLPVDAPPEVRELGRQLPVVEERCFDDTDVALVRGEARGVVEATTAYGESHGHWDDGFDPERWEGWRNNVEGAVEAIGRWLDGLDGVAG